MMDHNVRMANTVTISLSMYEAMKAQLERQEKIIKELSENIDKMGVTHEYVSIMTGRFSDKTFKYEGKDEVIQGLMKEIGYIGGRINRLTSYLATRASRRERRRFITKGTIFESWLT
jgi:hypothetical protein